MNMRNVSELAIEKVIIHILNNREENPTLIDFPLELTNDIYSLFEKHIKNSINDESTRIAKFDGDINVVKECCKSIIKSPDNNFVPKSKEIAKYLFDIMKNNNNISPANFAVCIYSINNEKNIALLKMDFSKLIQTKVENIGDKKKKIKVIVSSNGIPNNKQKLQKCVFIRPDDPKNDYDIILLDRQAIKSKKDDMVANFFSNAFLHCKLTKTDRDNTRMFKAYTQKFIEKNYSDNVAKSEDIRSHLFSTLKSAEEVNIKSFAEEVFSDNEDKKKEYISYISENLGDFKFNIDKSWVNTYIRRKRIKTNTNVEINIDFETSEDKEKFDIKKHENDDKVDIIIKNVSSYSEVVTK